MSFIAPVSDHRLHYALILCFLYITLMIAGFYYRSVFLKSDVLKVFWVAALSVIQILCIFPQANLLKNMPFWLDVVTISEMMIVLVTYCIMAALKFPFKN